MKIAAIIQLTQRAKATLQHANTTVPYGRRWTCPACSRSFDGDETGIHAHARCCALLRDRVEAAP